MPLPIKSLHVRTKLLQRVKTFTEEEKETSVTVKHNQLLGAGDAYWNLAKGIVLKYESKDIPHLYKVSRVIKIFFALTGKRPQFWMKLKESEYMDYINDTTLRKKGGGTKSIFKPANEIDLAGWSKRNFQTFQGESVDPSILKAYDGQNLKSYIENEILQIAGISSTPSIMSSTYQPVIPPRSNQLSSCNNNVAIGRSHWLSPRVDTNTPRINKTGEKESFWKPNEFDAVAHTPPKSFANMIQQSTDCRSELVINFGTERHPNAVRGSKEKYTHMEAASTNAVPPIDMVSDVDVLCTYDGLQILPHDADMLLDCLNFTEVDVSCTYDGLQILPHDVDVLLDCFNLTEPEYYFPTTNKRRKLQRG